MAPEVPPMWHSADVTLSPNRWPISKTLAWAYLDLLGRSLTPPSKVPSLSPSPGHGAVSCDERFVLNISRLSRWLKAPQFRWLLVVSLLFRSTKRPQDFIPPSLASCKNRHADVDITPGQIGAVAGGSATWQVRCPPRRGWPRILVHPGMGYGAANHTSLGLDPYNLLRGDGAQELSDRQSCSPFTSIRRPGAPLRLLATEQNLQHSLDRRFERGCSPRVYA